MATQSLTQKLLNFTSNTRKKSAQLSFALKSAGFTHDSDTYAEALKMLKALTSVKCPELRAQIKRTYSKWGEWKCKL